MNAMAEAKRPTQSRKVSRLLHPVILKWTGSVLFTLRNTKVQRRCFGFARLEILVVGSSMFHNSATVRKEAPNVARNKRRSESVQSAFEAFHAHNLAIAPFAMHMLSGNVDPIDNQSDLAHGNHLFFLFAGVYF